MLVSIQIAFDVQTRQTPHFMSCFRPCHGKYDTLWHNRHARLVSASLNNVFAGFWPPVPSTIPAPHQNASMGNL
jgi:hypothetical protein